MLFYGSFCEILTLAVSFKENMAGLGNGKSLVWLCLECLTVAVGSEVDQEAWPGHVCVSIHIAACSSPFILWLDHAFGKIYAS